MAQFKNTANRTNSEYPSASAPYVPTTTSPVSNTTKVHLSGAKQVHEGDAARYHVELDLSPIGKANSSVALLKALSDLQGKGILFGQQHAIDVGISSADSHGHRSDVHAMTGKYPAVFGFDTDEPPVETDGSPDATGKAFAKAFIEADSLGSVVTLSSHLHNPVSDGEAFDIDSSVAVDRLLPGGDLNHKITDWLDTVATAANNSIRGDGSKIPIIFRPLHENTGDWFWWGKGHMSADDFKALWQYVHDYLTETKGVDNLLFAYSPNYPLDGSKENYLATYPGDKYVDIMGYDAYQSDNDQPDADWMQDTVHDLVMVNQLAVDHGKVSALTEFGLNNDRVIQRSGGNQNIHFFSQFLDAIQANPEAAKFAYMMTWANWGDNTDDGKFQSYTPWPGHEMEADFKNFVNRLTLANPANEDVTVTVTIEHGSSDSADLNISTQQVTIRKGESGADFTIDALKDGKAEGNENYTVKISKVQGADIGSGEVQTTIVDADSHYIMHEDFSNRAIGSDYTADTNSGWKNAYHSGHAKIIDRGNGNKALEITSDKNVSALITGPEAGANFEYSGTLSTGTQLGGNNAQAWETARAVWGYRDVDNYYYFIPKANGWELGKRDTAAPDGVRYLATGSEPSFAPGADKHFTVIQNGGKMRVRINGQEIVTFEDSQNPFIGGKVGLQASNARIIADDLSLKTVAEHSLPDNHVGHVSISGEAKVGETLTAHVTDGDNFAHDNVFYIWYADNVRIEGVSGNTLTLGKAQQGKSITVQAIYTDAHGVSETPVSAPSTKVGNSGYLLYDDFSSHKLHSTYSDQETFGDWKVAHAGYGKVEIIDNGGGNQALQLGPMVRSGETDTSSSMVVSTVQTGDTFTYSGTIATPEQLRQNAPPHAWETAWLVWNYTDNDHYYYFVPRANGWELGKRDPAYKGGQRFMATGSESWPLAEAKDFVISKHGNTVEISINGKVITTFTDDERPYTGGSIGLYTEDARIIADDIHLTPTANITGTANHGGIAAISGTAATGAILQAAIHDSDGVQGNISYQWMVAGKEIPGATGASYAITPENSGKSITVRITYTDNTGKVESVISPPTAVVDSGNDGGANHPGQVTLHGRAAIGETLTTTVSDADGMPEIIQYTWMADGKAIEGANGSSYTITAADVGKVISVQAYYYDNAGHEEVVLSNATGAVPYFSAAANPENGDLTHPVQVIDTTPAFPTLVPHNSDGEYNPSGEGVNLGTIASHEQTLNLDVSAPSHIDNASAVQHHDGINATSDGNDSLPDCTNAAPLSLPQPV
ncbi:glycosyl hydrolase [uncultured Cardiobacterium sp.]|uniref:glycosyl hydrolase n=1 Tax=uncultured Cardiobacterium sp. TaxID=417619 RepID=UPI00261A1D71|nr:glycosyl hydrolase [uncultured Cardiobacterium sp.]